MSTDTSFTGKNTVNISNCSYIDLNTGGKPRWKGALTLPANQQTTPATINLVANSPGGDPNEIQAIAGFTFVPVEFSIAIESWGTPQIIDTGNNAPTPPTPVLPIIVKLVGLVIPYNNRHLGSSPLASQFATIVNPHHTTALNASAADSTWSYSVDPESAMMVYENTVQAGEAWRFSLYLYYYFTDTNGNAYAGTAYWDPYVDHEN